jgi:hypothetical protein
MQNETGFQISSKREKAPEDLEADANCNMLEQDLMDLIPEARRRRGSSSSSKVLNQSSVAT